MLPNRLGRWLARLARAQVTRPLPFVCACLLLALGCLLPASRLERRTRVEELLPQTRSSVLELKRLQANTANGSHLSVVVESGGVAQQRAFGDALVERMSRAAPAWLVDCADGVHAARAFLEPRAALFAPLSALQQLEADVDARWSWEVGRETGTNLDADDGPPPLDLSRLKQRLGVPATERYPDGYFQSAEAGTLVVFVDTSLASGAS
jgi:hypothetical protein